MRIALTILMAGLLGSLGCSNSGPNVTSAASMTSAELKQMVQSKLSSDPQLTQVDVSADADSNQVTLSGSVASEQARSDAVDMARSIRPNVQVVDKIDVKPPEISRNEYTSEMAREAREKAKSAGDRISESINDAWIYSKVKAKLAGNSTTPALQINVDVTRNVVTLRGNVDSETVKEEAERVARNTGGVKEVRNLLRVKA
jgi:hyperosmotically inducible protein